MLFIGHGREVWPEKRLRMMGDLKYPATAGTWD